MTFHRITGHGRARVIPSKMLSHSWPALMSYGVSRRKVEWSHSAGEEPLTGHVLYFLVKRHMGRALFAQGYLLH